MSAVVITRLRSLTFTFKNYKKSLYVSTREHQRHLSNMISKLVEMGYELTDEQQVDAVIRSLPNDWSYIKMVLS